MYMQKRNWMLTALVFAVAAPASAQQRSDAEDRLRDMLRQTTIELRDAQSQNLELRAKIDELNAKGAAATASAPRANVDTAALRRAQSEAEQLRTALAEARRAIEERDQAMAQWQLAYGQAEQLARTRDADAKRLDELQQTLTQRVDTCERDNAQLVDVAEEVLEKYRRKGVWDAMRDAEPLTGIHRVQLETLAQKYHARILDLQAKPNAAVSDAQP
jgi:YD repeat-containing protein